MDHDLRSVRSAASSRRSRASCRSMASSAVPERPVLEKAPRFDKETKKALHNCFSEEIMHALNGRGGATWLRSAQEEATAQHNSQGAQDLYKAVKHMGSSGFQIDMNEHFGLQKLEKKLNKTLINRLTKALQQVAKERHDESGDLIEGGLSVDYSDFVNAIHSAGLDWVGKDNMKIMFETVDDDKSGFMSFSEWIKHLESGDTTKNGKDSNTPAGSPVSTDVPSDSVAASPEPQACA